MSSNLIWELVRGYHSRLHKGLNGAVFSSEPGNLYNKHSYKYSGLANLEKTVGVDEVDGAVAIVTSSVKKPGKMNVTRVKKNARRANHAAGAVAASRRRDLKAAAQARASAVSRSLRKRKALAENA